MKIKDIYSLFVEKGIEHDPRGKETVHKILKKAKEDYNELKEDQKKEFDREKLTNPYADSRFLYGNPEKNVKRLMFGVDIDTSELLLADRLSKNGKEIDLVIGHHPLGKAYANFYEVMGMQAEIFNQVGVPINVAESMMAPRIREVERRVMPGNHLKTSDAAELLGIPLMCAHTVADNQVVWFLQALIDKKGPETIKEIMKLLKEVPEYAYAQKNNNGPKILAGCEGNKAGKIFVEMTGGTECAKEIYERVSQAGVGTIIGMHFSEDHKKEIEKHHLNAIVAGHISSDNLGINLLLDEVNKKEKKLEVVACSGFHRVSRIK